MKSQGHQAFGDVILTHPVSHFALVGIGLVLLLVMCSVFIIGQYTRHATIDGVLEPTGGLVKVYPQQGGVLKQTLVRDGQRVHKGDVLLIFTSEHDGASGIAIEGQSEGHVRERLDSLHQELDSLLALSRVEAANARESLSALHSARQNLNAQIKNQTERVGTSQGVLNRFVQLQQSGFVSEIQIQAKRDDLTDQQVHLQSMQKDLISNEADISRLDRDIASFPLKAAVTRAQLERSIAEAEANLAVLRNAHEWSVTAPCDGLVSSLAVNIGQSVAVNTLLMMIVPSDAPLQATLYAPSRSLGFIRTGQDVRIKLDAYPFQKFGLVTGRVQEIANTPLLPGEISPLNRLIANDENAEPLYAINVVLERQEIEAYGHAVRLRPGLQLSADIQLDTRHLYEWMLEPLYSMKRG